MGYYLTLGYNPPTDPITDAGPEGPEHTVLLTKGTLRRVLDALGELPPADFAAFKAVRDAAPGEG